MKIAIRRYGADDLDALLAIFEQSVLAASRDDYSDAQCAAWAGAAHNIERWRRQFAAHRTLVACDGTVPVGFADLSPGGLIDTLYILKEYQRKGIASLLLRHLLDEARAAGMTIVRTEANNLSRPIFERAGFHVVERVEKLFRGQPFRNFHMECRI